MPNFLTFSPSVGGPLELSFVSLTEGIGECPRDFVLDMGEVELEDPRDLVLDLEEMEMEDPRDLVLDLEEVELKEPEGCFL